MKHLLHIGYPKAGSTFLKHWFAHHPCIAYHSNVQKGYLTTQKLPGDTGWVVTCDETLTLTLGEDLSHIPTPQETRDRQARLAKQIRQNESVHTILMVTRGARSLYRSAYSQYLKAGGHLTYDKLRSDQDDRFTAMWDYDFVLDLYQSLFGAERVWVFPFEWLATDPDQFLRALEEKLGIPHAAFDRSPKNRALSETAMGQYRTLNRCIHSLFRPWPQPLRKRVQAWHRRSLGRGQFSWLLKRIPANPINCEPPEDLIKTLSTVSQKTRNQPYVKPFADYYR